MKLTIDKAHKDALHKACIENRFTVQFHENELNPLVVTAYIRDNQLGELSNVLAFWLAVGFTNNLYAETHKQYDTKLEWTDGGIYKFGGQDKFKRDEN
jgi:hypothetical protein